MRRLVVLLVVALVGVTFYGVSGRAGGLRVNGATVSGSTMRAELNAIAQSSTLQCYLSALNNVSESPGAGGATLSAAAVAAWSDARIQGLTIAHYVTTTLHHTPSATELRTARLSLEGELTQQVSAHALTCPGTAAQALDAMTPEMRHSELVDWAASLYLEAKLNSTLPLTTPALQSYFLAHPSNYDTLCVSIAVVAPASVATFEAAAQGGASVATLAHSFSLDAASAKHGGAYGCFSPLSSSYAAIRGDVAGEGLNRFAAAPQYVNLGGTTYALFVAVTKRSPTPFNLAEPLVLVDVRSQNASSANTLEKSLEYRASVYVDPALGRWGLDTTGPRVFTPALPSSATVLSPALLQNNPATYH
ncbi:MAG TPA: hypothetical protein VIC81_00775 [Acidimicrobiales bacterium]